VGSGLTQGLFTTVCVFGHMQIDFFLMREHEGPSFPTEVGPSFPTEVMREQEGPSTRSLQGYLARNNTPPHRTLQ
jgi:hypothetical protein